MLMNELTKNGWAINENFLAPQQAHELYSQMVNHFPKLADEIDCTVAEYLTAASRWGGGSILVSFAQDIIKDQLKPKLEEALQQPLRLIKANVISKSMHAPNPVPCHQDIAFAYQSKQPYDFSLWLALSDVGLAEGPLTLLPQSHLGAIEPAPDFWSPTYVDEVSKQPRWVQFAKSCCVNAGDAIFFDSALWHGSLKSQSNETRLALVTRWAYSDKVKTPNIPKPQSAEFGMWNCQSKTTAYLEKLISAKGLLPADDFVHLLEQAKNVVPELEWLEDKASAIQALRHLQILHQASNLHDAGDAHGRIYATVWLTLLKHIHRGYYEKHTQSDSRIQRQRVY